MSDRFKNQPVFDNKTKAIATIAGLTVVKDIVIVQSGVDKVGDLMDDSFIKSIVEHGNSAPTGIKSRAGHPNMCKDSLGTYLGDFHNFRAVEHEGKFKAIADLYLAEISKKTQIDGKGISYHDYIVEMAKSNPDKLGNSIVFRATEEPFTMEDKTEVRKFTLTSFSASDIVDSPAATDGLFKSTDDIGIKLTEFLDDNPGVLEAIEKNENAFSIFFKKYETHLSKTSNSLNMKSFKERMKAALGITVEKNIDVTDATGTILTVVTDNTEPQAGDEVQVAGTAAPDGDYTFPDGSKWVITGGKIESIEPAVAASTDPVVEPVVVPDVEAVKAMNELKAENAELKKSFTDYQKAADERMKELEDEFVKFATMVKSDYVPATKSQEHKDNKTKKATGRTLQEFLEEK